MTDDSKDAVEMNTLKLAADITAAYVEGNKLPSNEVAGFLETIFNKLEELANPPPEPLPEFIPQYPIDQSVTDDAIYCLEDGKPFKSLKRHLRSRYNLTPDEYRTKWGLPADYPMVAPSYARERAKIARNSGLGRGKA